MRVTKILLRVARVQGSVDQDEGLGDNTSYRAT